MMFVVVVVVIVLLPWIAQLVMLVVPLLNNIILIIRESEIQHKGGETQIFHTPGKRTEKSKLSLKLYHFYYFL